MSQRQVIIVGPEALHNFFANEFPEWDCQSVNPSIRSMWENRENGLISDDSSLIIFQDTLYEDGIDGDTEEDFAIAVATMASANILTVVVSYNPQIQDRILSDIQRQGANEAYRSEYGKHVPVEFVPYQIAVASIEEAIAFYERGEEAVQTFQAQNNTQAIDVNESFDHPKFDRDGKVITVTSSKGGSGKSTVSLLLATTLALSSEKAYQDALARGEKNPQEPLRVCVVDLDTFDGQLGFVLNQSTPTALNIALANTALDEELIWRNLAYSERMKFHALLAPVRGQTAKYTDSHFYSQVIQHLRTMFDVIILDTSVQHYDPMIKTVALPLADAVFVVTTLDIKSVKGLARWINVATAPTTEDGHGLDINKTGVIVNGSLHGVGIGLEELTAAALDAKLLVSIPLDTTAVQAAGNANRLEEIILSHKPISEAYYKLSKIVAPLLNNPALVNLTEEEDDNIAYNINPNQSSGRTTSSVKKPKRGFGGLFGKK